jgi:heat shock protein HslJ
MQNSRGANFGERLRVGIQVAGAPTPTPDPTQTPAPGISFSADAERVLQGNPVNLTWDVQGAQEVYFYQAGQDWQNRAVEAQGSAADIPNATTAYNLRVVRNAVEEIRTVTVYVDPNPDLPQVDYFTLMPSDELVLGACVELAWQIEGEVEQVAIFRNKELLWGEAPVQGTHEDCPQAAGAYEYAVGAQGPGGRNYAVGVLQVVEPGVVQAKNTPAGGTTGGPTIELFSVLPRQLAIGECAELRWTVGSAVSNIRIERDGAILMEGASRSGSGTDCPNKPGFLRYTITATNEQGRSDSAEAEVSVGAPSPTTIPVPAAAPAPTTTATTTTTVAAVAGAGTAAEATVNAPVGKEYVLILYRDASGVLASPLTGTRTTALFGAEGNLRGDGGCNTYATTYQINGDQLTIAPLAGAQEFCSKPIGIMDQEVQYLSVLQTAATYILDGGLLTLLDGAGNQIAVFVAAQ